MAIPSRPRVVVTGAGSGLGRAFVLELAAREGARIVVSDLDEASARTTAAEASARGAEVVAIGCDVREPDAVEGLVAECERRFGGFDVIVNNAGVAVAGLVGDVSLDDWRWIVSINLMGVVHGCHAAAKRLRAQKRGHVINVASAAGLVAAPGMAPYNATKFGVVGLSEALYAELRPHGVGVTVLCPTFFPTNIVEAGRGDGPGSNELREMAKRMMAASKLDATDVARAALRAADGDHLYSVPMPDGRALWWMKRFAPEQWYARLGPAVMKLAERRFRR